MRAFDNKSGKHGCIRLSFFMLVLLGMLYLMLPCAVSEPYYEEGIHLVRPESGYMATDYYYPVYIEIEDLVFLTCTEHNLPVRASLLCLDNNNFVDLPTYRWTHEQNCYLSDYNLQNFKCKNMQIQSEYVMDDETYRLTKKVKVNKLTKVLDHILENQFSDGGWRDSLSTAYGIWALSFYREIFDDEIMAGMRWLKLNRNEEKKCWPKSPCDYERTANILALLTVSNYTDYYRILNDGNNLMARMHNYYQSGDIWTIGVYPLVPYTTLVLVSYDHAVLSQNFILQNMTWKYFNIAAGMNKEIIVISDENVKVTVHNQEMDELLLYQGDNMSYTLPGACWSKHKKGEPCHLRTTLWAAMQNLSDEQIDAAKDYLITTLKNSSLVGWYVGDENDSIDTSLFLYAMQSSHEDETFMSDVTDWLTYHQNNDGSWGEGNYSDRAIPTSLAVMALLKRGFSRSSEQVDDAEDWASDHEEDTDWNNTMIQAGLLSILKNNARPLVTSSPRVILVSDRVTAFDLFNPTTFNLKEVDYKFSDELKDILSIEKKTQISSYSYRKMKITKTGEQSSDVYGYLHVYNLGQEIGRIPVIVTDVPFLNISFPDRVYVFGTSQAVELSASKSAHEFICSAAWESDEVKTPGSFKIQSSSASLAISFDSAETKEEVYRGKVACDHGEKHFEFPVSLYVTRFSGEPLSVEAVTPLVNSSSQNMVVEVKNNLDRDLSVDVSMDGNSEFYDYEQKISLNPNEMRNFTLYSRVPPDMNLTGTASVKFSALGRSRSAEVVFDIIYIPKPNLDYLKLIIVLFFVFSGLGGLGYLGYRKRDELIELVNRLNIVRMRSEIGKGKKQISEIKEEEKSMIITNLYNILRFQNKDDKEIRDILLRNFTREQVKEALEKSGNSLSGLEEDVPEKL